MRGRDVLAVGICFIAGFLLLDDGSSTVLSPRDASLGRRYPACYTALEQIVGVSEPSLIRPAELIAGVGLMTYAPLLVWRRRRQQGKAGTVA